MWKTTESFAVEGGEEMLQALLSVVTGLGEHTHTPILYLHLSSLEQVQE